MTRRIAKADREAYTKEQIQAYINVGRFTNEPWWRWLWWNIKKPLITFGVCAGILTCTSIGLNVGPNLFLSLPGLLDPIRALIEPPVEIVISAGLFSFFVASIVSLFRQKRPGTNFNLFTFVEGGCLVGLVYLDDAALWGRCPVELACPSLCMDKSSVIGRRRSDRSIKYTGGHDRFAVVNELLALLLGGRGIALMRRRSNHSPTSIGTAFGAPVFPLCVR
jgi:hypothetical protein